MGGLPSCALWGRWESTARRRAGAGPGCSARLVAGIVGAMTASVLGAASRPRLGLVLGGGGVRGLAHVGVLSGLGRLGIRPDVLVGVSMGALVTATYAAREDWMAALESVDRSRLPAVANPEDVDALAKLRGALRSARRLAPSVWTFGRQGYEEYGREILESVLGERADFSDLRLPAAIIATDLDDGERVVLREGELISAVLASGAIPGLTRPIRRQGRTLIDGGFSDPSPVDVARELGADVVVAVHVSQHLLGTEADNWATALLRGFETSQRHFADERLAHADLVLRPAFPERVTMLDFGAVDEVVRCGVRCVKAHVQQVAAVAGVELSPSTASTP